VRRVVLNLHHRPETITRIVGDGSTMGMEVRYSWEAEPLGSAGGPARALPLLAADRFLVVNGDTLAGVDVPGLASIHVSSGALVTMAVAPADLTRYNAVVSDPSGAVTGFLRRSAGQTEDHLAPGGRPWHFVGVQAASAAAFASVDPDRPSESVADLYPRLIAARPGSIRVFPIAGRFHDIGTPADYLETVRRVAAEERRAFDRGEGTVVEATAHVDGSVLWDRVHIGAGAEVIDCIVTDDVAIPAGARYHRQAITRDAIEPLDGIR
jgi:NDP-sugar pyrophosphorylase family protein